MARSRSAAFDDASWSSFDLSTLHTLGFEPLGQLGDGVQTVGVLRHPSVEAWLLLFEGTPFLEVHSVLRDGFAVVTTDCPLRVDEYGEHEGVRDRSDGRFVHRFAGPDGLLKAHREAIEEVRPQHGPPRSTGRLADAARRLPDLAHRRSVKDLVGIFSLVAILFGTILLAALVLDYFQD